MFCSIVGQASFQTAGPMGPSIIDRSYGLGFFWTAGAGSAIRVGMGIETDPELYLRRRIW
jgi:hypothetical protein